MGVEGLFEIPPAAGLSLESVNDTGAGGGGDMTEESLGISLFLQLLVSAETDEKSKNKNNGIIYFHTSIIFMHDFFIYQSAVNILPYLVI
jgi:hypothetical protein